MTTAEHASAIAALIKGEVITDELTLKKYSVDTSIFEVMPAMVVRPRNTDDVLALVRYASDHAGEVSLTARSAGTDMSGGPLTSSIVVDFLAHFDEIKEVTSTYAVTQPGVFYRDFEPKTLAQGALLPSYTASRELNTVGGMVANNSAGEKSLTFGKTERYVKALRVVLSDGNEYTFKKLARSEWEDKKQQSNFEGALYRSIDSIITAHRKVINRERPTVNKNSAGYSIWNVHNEADDTFDMTQLIVGSQGTLGLITEITFSLVAPRPESRMAVMFLRAKHLPKLGAIINRVLKERPESFESYDDKTFNVMLKVFPKLFMRLGGNPLKLARDFWPEMKLVMTGGIPKLVLMAEFTGTEEKEVVARATAAAAALKNEFGLSTRVTRDAAEANKFWLIRRESFKLLRENVKGTHTAPFIDDISVEPKYLPEFLPKLYKILDEYDLIYTVAGHVGDGNFHIIPLMDFSRPDFTKIIHELSERVYTLVGEYHGSITGEHNDGIIRTPYLHKMFSSEMLDIFTKIKDAFDPRRIFNPHKKVDPSRELLENSIRRTTPD